MAIVIVSGLPYQVNTKDLTRNLRNILNRLRRLFWIRELETTRGSHTKDATIEFQTGHDAVMAQARLDGLNYRHMDGMSYPLRAWVEDGHSMSPVSPDHYDRRSPASFHSLGYDRSRSRSPLSHHPHYESSKLDIELEMLRKRRMVIEEERKLLLERKKLHLLKDYSPSRSADRELDDRYRERRRSRERTSYKYEKRYERRSPRRHEPSERNYNYDKYDYNKYNYDNRSYNNGQPKVYRKFMLPCKKLILEMKEYIDQFKNDQEKTILQSLIRNTLRQRITIILKGKAYTPTVGIIALYRKKYPASSDAELVRSFKGKIDDRIEISEEDYEDVYEDMAGGEKQYRSRDRIGRKGKGNRALPSSRNEKPKGKSTESTDLDVSAPEPTTNKGESIKENETVVKKDDEEDDGQTESDLKEASEVTIIENENTGDAGETNESKLKDNEDEFEENKSDVKESSQNTEEEAHSDLKDVAIVDENVLRGGNIEDWGSGGTSWDEEKAEEETKEVNM